MNFEKKSEIIEKKSEIIENMENKDLSEKSEIIEKKNFNIYRYKLSDHIIELIKEFINYHKYDDRKIYKESWNDFCKEYNDIILRETNRLVDNGYEGSVTDKMYKAGRYYYLKKNNEIKKEKKRRIYICMDSDVIYSMDEHIKNNIKIKTFKPANGYKDFYNNNINIIKEETERLINTYNTNNKLIDEKIKKTYKNRYYIISRNNNENII